MHMEERDFTLSCLALPLRASLSLVRSHSLALSQEQLGYCDGQPATLAPRSQVPKGHFVSTPPPVSPVQRDTGPSGGWRYGARCLCWARAPRGSATRQRVVPTDRHSFVACQ